MKKLLYLLLIATIHISVHCSEYTIEKSVNKSDIENKTPLWYAVHNNNLQIATLLLVHKASPSSYYKGPSYFKEAIENTSQAIINLLLNYKADINMSDEKNNTALHYAIQKYVKAKTLDNSNYYEIKSIIDILLKANADLAIENTNKETPLLLAVKGNCLELVTLLLSTKSNSDQEDSSTNDELVV